jgi:hypothetical protein
MPDRNDVLVDPMGNVGVITTEVHPIDHNDGCGVTELIGQSAFIQESMVNVPDGQDPCELIIRGPDRIETTRW